MAVTTCLPGQMHVSSLQLGCACTSLSQQLHSLLSLNLKVTGDYSGIQTGVRHPNSAVRTPRATVASWKGQKRFCLNYSACAVHSVLQGLVPLDERDPVSLSSFSSRVYGDQGFGASSQTRLSCAGAIECHSAASAAMFVVPVPFTNRLCRV